MGWVLAVHLEKRLKVSEMKSGGDRPINYFYSELFSPFKQTARRQRTSSKELEEQAKHNSYLFSHVEAEEVSTRSALWICQNRSRKKLGTRAFINFISLSRAVFDVIGEKLVVSCAR